MAEFMKSHETEEKTHMVLGDVATGAIQAETEYQKERVNEATERLAAGEFHKTTDRVIPCKCIDGRSCSHGASEGPNSAGGTLSVFVADDLTRKRFQSADGSVAGGYANALDVLKREEYDVGGHTDDHASGDKSGCGAADRLPEIYQKIAHNGEWIREQAEAILGHEIDEETHQMLVSNAAQRVQFDSGTKISETLNKSNDITDADTMNEQLEGSHNEVIAVINLIEGTTLDRDSLRAAFGDELQAFNVDGWSFAHAADKTSLDSDEVNEKVAAMTYYNLATALALCGPAMRVIVRK